MGTERARRLPQIETSSPRQRIRLNRNSLRVGVLPSDPSGDLRTTITVTAGASPVPSCFLILVRKELASKIPARAREQGQGGNTLTNQTSRIGAQGAVIMTTATSTTNPRSRGRGAQGVQGNPREGPANARLVRDPYPTKAPARTGPS